jgi:hypothetical protein
VVFSADDGLLEANGVRFSAFDGALVVAAGSLEADDDVLLAAVELLLANDVDLVVAAGLLMKNDVVVVAAAGLLVADDVRLVVGVGFLVADDVVVVKAAGLLEADGVSPKSHVVVLVEDARGRFADLVGPSLGEGLGLRPAVRRRPSLPPQCISRPNPDFPSRGDDDLEEGVGAPRVALSFWHPASRSSMVHRSR